MPKSKPKHTELPYKLESDGQDIEILTENGKIRIAFICHSGFGLSGENKETAAFLVRAANNHYKLIGALRKCYDKMPEPEQSDDNPAWDKWDDLKQLAEAAIREAEKED